MKKEITPEEFEKMTPQEQDALIESGEMDKYEWFKDRFLDDGLGADNFIPFDPSSCECK